MSGAWEIAANAVATLSIALAGLNSRHTWWTGILGCVLFARVFFAGQLYADAALQGFFIVTSAIGWWTWRRQKGGAEIPVRRVPPRLLVSWTIVGGVVAAAYGWLLHLHTDAYAPFLDSAVAAFSVAAQLLLMGRRYETWWFWLLVNTIAVPLFASRGLHLTAILYGAYWINAAVALVRWRKLIREA